MVLVLATRTSGCAGVQDPHRIEQDGELYHTQDLRRRLDNLARSSPLTPHYLHG